MPLLNTYFDNTCLCSNCHDHLHELFEAKGFNLEAVASVEYKEHEADEQTLQCDNCNAEIEIGEDYHIITMAQSTLEDVADILSEDIAGCFQCEGDELARFAHSFNKDPYDSESRIELSLGTEVSEYLSSRDVPDEFIDLFSKLIVCQKCGYGGEPRHHSDNPDGGVFEQYDEIYTKRDIANFWGYEYAEFMEFARKYGFDLSHEHLIDFQDHLMAYPMLGYLHPTGQLVYNLLKNHFDNKDYCVLNQKTKLFRGRTRKKDTSRPYKKNELWSPPEGNSSHGRFNTVGVPVLYVSDCLDGIPYEVPPAHDELLDIIEYDLQKDLFVFDIGAIDRAFQGFFTQINEESKLLKRAYLLPNFIGTCCSHIGFDGVRYEGVHKINTKYTNYALFTVKEHELSAGEPVTYIPNVTYNLQEKPKDTKQEDYF